MTTSRSPSLPRWPSYPRLVGFRALGPVWSSSSLSASNWSMNNAPGLQISSRRDNCLALFARVSDLHRAPFHVQTKSRFATRVWSNQSRSIRVQAAGSIQKKESDSENQLKPAYKKYLSQAELARHNFQEWKELSADGVYVPPPTVASKLLYPIQFVKYNFVPEIVRYAWYHVWVRLCKAYGPYHKKLILEDRPLYVPRYADVGAKLDAYLQQKSQPGQPAQINKRTALQRYHWKMSPLQSLVNRLQLVGAALLSVLFRWRRRNIQQAEESQLAAPKII